MRKRLGLTLLVAAIASGCDSGGGVLSATEERIVSVLLFPETVRLDRERQQRMYDRWESISDRSATTW